LPVYSLVHFFHYPHPLVLLAQAGVQHSSLKMSDFSQLKQKRKANQTRSFVTSDIPGKLTPGKHETDELDKMEVVDSEVSSQGTLSGGPILLDLHSPIPPTLDVRVTEQNGRGIYSKFNRRPGE